MNIKLIWTLLTLYRRVKQVRKETIMEMGWKTIAGSILIGLGYAAKSLASFEQSFDAIGDGIIALGAMLGGIGLRAAIAKK